MKKSVFAALSTAVFLLGAVNPTSATAAEGYGPGVATCAAYLTDRSQDAMAAESLYFSWAQGYLTRLNWFEVKLRGAPTANLLPSGFGISQQITWINTYCASHPSTLYGDAAYQLYLTIREVQGYSS